MSEPTKPARFQVAVLPYLIALAPVLAATLVRAAIDPIFPDGRPFITYFAAVACAAWYGGTRAGIAAIIASYLLADFLFITPRYQNAIVPANLLHWVDFLLFTGVSTVIVAITGAMHRVNTRCLAEIQRTEQNHRTLLVTLTSIGDGVITTDDQGRITFLNRVAESLTKWTLEEAHGQPLMQVFQIVNELTRQPVEDPCSKVLRTGTIVGLANHTVLIGKDGSECPIDDSAAPITADCGKIVGVVLVFRDASEQRQTFEAVQRLALLVEQSEDAIVSKDVGGIVTSWNDGARQLFGYTAEEAIGRHISFLVPHDQVDEHAANMLRLKQGERIDHWDTIRRKKDGSLVPVSVRISPIRNTYGEVVGASKIARDATERKKAEASLEFLAKTSTALAALVDRNSALHQAASAMVPHFADWCAVYMIRGDGGIEFAACAHRDSAAQQRLEAALRDYPVDWNTPAITVRTLRTGETQFVADVPGSLLAELAHDQQRVEIIHEFKPHSVISVPLRIRDKTIGALSFITVESSQRQYTPHDIQLASDLGRRVAISLDNAQLFQSVKAADRQKDEFLAMLAHELRNPLAAIRYAIELARLPGVDPKVELVDMVERQVENLAHLIDDLLDISRISRGKIQLRKDSHDAVVLIRRAAAAIRPLMEERKHTLTLNLPVEPLPLSADSTRIEQIIGNLLTNAAKYTPEGGRIHVSADADDGEAVVKVKDSGVGISPDVLPHIFELFTQADRSLDRAQGGLGIGLTVVQKLAELHGGTVAAYSEGVGQGSEFIVRLPLGSSPVTGSTATPRGGVAVVNPLRVLIVEDNRDTARAETMLLQSQGHEVRVVHDGSEAVSAATAFQPDVMLVDIGLPGLNGFDVAAAVRRQGLTAITLIAVSGYGQVEDQQRSRAAGFNHHLVKPVDNQDLFALLQKITPRP